METYKFLEPYAGWKTIENLNEYFICYNFYLMRFGYYNVSIIKDKYKGVISVYKFFDNNIKIEIPKFRGLCNIRGFNSNYNICTILLLFHLYSSENLIILPEKVYMKFQRSLIHNGFNNFMYKNGNYISKNKYDKRFLENLTNLKKLNIVLNLVYHLGNKLCINNVGLLKIICDNYNIEYNIVFENNKYDVKLFILNNKKALIHIEDKHFEGLIPFYSLDLIYFIKIGKYILFI